eukprot:TRINITY_DN68606_c0_g1_i1.p1 TRINITY_DN68606_c0_g1~~TRINITY_DN68606_c0_g1_i1.p1  ORF type:complete len:229 (-),score=11.28 TRINITY_DN68606_c0_g1_i1:552-1238(-)
MIRRIPDEAVRRLHHYKPPTGFTMQRQWKSIYKKFPRRDPKPNPVFVSENFHNHAINTFQTHKPRNIAKKYLGKLKLKIYAGKASMAPPVGTTFAAFGLKAINFVKEFNDATAHLNPNILLMVKGNVYTDKTYDYAIKHPKSSELIKIAAGITDGSPRTGHTYVGYVTPQMIYHLALIVARTSERERGAYRPAFNRIVSQCRSMGVGIITPDTPVEVKEISSNKSEDE